MSNVAQEGQVGDQEGRLDHHQDQVGDQEDRLDHHQDQVGDQEGRLDHHQGRAGDQEDRLDHHQVTVFRILYRCCFLMKCINAGAGINGAAAGGNRFYKIRKKIRKVYYGQNRGTFI